MDTGYAEQIHHLMAKFRKLGAGANFGDMTQGEFMILKTIKMISERSEGVTISTLSERLRISKSAVSQMINSLEDKGYVERFTTRNDRRLVYVRLTVRGGEVLSEKLRTFLKGMNTVFDKMGEEDTKELLRLLRKLYDIYKSTQGENQ